MEFTVLNKDKTVNKEYKIQVCFGGLQYHKTKSEVGYVHYKPKDLPALTPLTKEEKIQYLSELERFPFFIHENKNIEDIINNGILVPSFLPINNLFVVLLLTRYIEEKPSRIRAFLHLRKEGISLKTALAVCHLLQYKNKTLSAYAYLGNHDLLEVAHFYYDARIKNYDARLFDYMNSATSFNKCPDGSSFRLWSIFNSRTDKQRDNYYTVTGWPVSKIIEYARRLDSE